MTEERVTGDGARATPQLAGIIDRLGRVLGGFLVVYLFLLLLMTQIAQQSVMLRLEKADASLSYSGASVAILADEGREQEARRLQIQLSGAERVLSGERGDLAAAEIGIATSRSQFLPIALAVREPCGLNFSQETPSSIDEAWLPAFSCGSLSPEQRRRLQDMQGDGRLNLPSQRDHIATLQNAIAGHEAEIAATRQSLADLRAQLATNRPIHAAFDEMNVIRQGWLLGGRYLIDIPPALLQLPLAFASGCFGALLISLILVVYPNARIGETGGRHAIRRTMLGGLIAICVYIVLLSGTAVLGTSHGLGDGNHMTFSAIGILAGMFSDRVAAWLSDRANGFFGRVDEAGARHDASGS